MRINDYLIKPSGPNCNLACDYCFYRDKSSLYPGRTRMPLSTLEEFISQALGDGGPVSFSWQGGEPTLMGLDFFKDVVSFQKKHGSRRQKVSNSLQTNGTLIDEQWARFLYKYNFLVGLSLDGPRDLHDHYRKYPDGSGSYGEVIRASEILQRFDVPFNVLTVLNSRTVKQPTRMVNFFLQNGFTHFQFIPAIEVVTTEDVREIAPFSPRPEEVGEFLDIVFQKCSEEFPPTFSVRYFDSLLRVLLGGEPGLCRMRSTCGSYLVIEYNGDVYPCDFFVEEEKRLGNLTEAPLKALEENEPLKDFVRNKSQLPAECRECEFLPYCYGGCPRNRGLPSGPKDKTYLCESYKYFLSRNLEELKKIAARIK